MSLHWTIVKINAGWALKCTQLHGHHVRTMYRREFLKLIDAIEASQTLQVHVLNIAALPLTQYKTGESR